MSMGRTWWTVCGVWQDLCWETGTPWRHCCYRRLVRNKVLPSWLRQCIIIDISCFIPDSCFCSYFNSLQRVVSTVAHSVLHLCVVRSDVRGGGGSHRADDVCHQTGSRGDPTCWENSGQEGVDTHRRIHDNSLYFMFYNGTAERRSKKCVILCSYFKCTHLKQFWLQNATLWH